MPGKKEEPPSSDDKSSRGGKESRKQPIKQTKIDDKLLGILEKGDEQTYISMVYQSFKKPLTRYLYTLVEAPFRDKIEDIEQEGYRLFFGWVKRKKERQLSLPLPFNHFDYLCRIMQNVYFEEYIRRKKHPTESLNASDDGTQEQIESNIEYIASMKTYDPEGVELTLFLKEVGESIESLREPYRTVMRLIRDRDLSEKEIARLMNRPEDRVRTWINRGRNMLKKKHPEHLEYLQPRQGKEVK